MAIHDPARPFEPDYGDRLTIRIGPLVHPHEVATDPRLSYAAKGLYSTLAATSTGTIALADLAASPNDAITVLAALGQLEATGHLTWKYADLPGSEH